MKNLGLLLLAGLGVLLLFVGDVSAGGHGHQRSQFNGYSQRSQFNAGSYHVEQFRAFNVAPVAKTKRVIVVEEFNANAGDTYGVEQFNVDDSAFGESAGEVDEYDGTSCQSARSSFRQRQRFRQNSTADGDGVRFLGFGFIRKR